MKVQELQLQNIQSYVSETIEFDDGETLIYGENGAGKTTILRAIFGALFQNRSAHQIHSGYTLDKLVRKGEQTGRIVLKFEVDSAVYTIEWVLEAEQSNGEREFKGTKKCVLTSPALEKPIEGVKSVRATVEELIGMDAQSFVNSVYVQQGDITRLLYATAKERKEIFDGLLGLTQIDTRIERLDEARLGVNDTLSATETNKKDIEQRLETLPSKSEIQTEINDLRTRKEKREERLEKVEAKKAELKTQKQELEDKIGTIEETKETLENIKTQLEEANNERESYGQEIKEIEDKISQLSEKADEKREKAVELQQELDIQESEAENVKKRVEAIEQTIEKTKQEKGDIKSDINTKQTEISHKEELASNKEEEIESIEEQIEKSKETLETLKSNYEEVLADKSQLETVFEDDYSAFIEAVHNVNSSWVEEDPSEIENYLTELIEKIFEKQVKKLSAEIEQAKEKKGEENAKSEFIEQLEETGVCPICQTEHENSEHIGQEVSQKSSVEQEIERLKEEREEIKTLISQAKELREKARKKETIKQKIEEKARKKETVTDEISELKEKKSTVSEEVNEDYARIEELEEELETLEETLEEISQKLTELTQNKQKYESLYNSMKSHQELVNEQESVQENLESKKELKQKTIQRITDLQERRNKLQEKLDGDGVSSLESRLEEVSEERQDYISEEKQLSEELESLRNNIADKKAKRNQVESEEERLQETKAKYEWLQDRKTEIKKLKERYTQVKKELREENIALLNKFTNDIFTELHSGRSIQAINIDSDYSITLVKQDNSEISPDMSSGGESNTVNLAIRAGIYRLISEREGKGMLPPFILDEPTQFLDDAHIDELQSFITAIKNWDIPQLLVVSHEPSLIDNANSVLQVEIDRTNGESSVSQEHHTLNIGENNA